LIRTTLFKFPELVVALTLIFNLHRALSFANLLPTDDGGGDRLHIFERSKIFFVGFLSDFWISNLLALLAFAFSLTLAHFTPRKNLVKNSWMCPLIILGVGFMAALHQGYVEFFRFQLVPFHLSYLIDLSFLAANGKSMAETNSIVILCFSALFAFLITRPTQPLPRVFAPMVLVLGLLAHNRNIHWRVQWFIPDHLQVNFLENLYFHLSKRSTPEPLRPHEWKRLLSSLNNNAIPNSQDPFQILNALSPQLPRLPDLHPIALELRNEFKQAVLEGKKPLLLIVLLESLRPSEMGFFATPSRSLTPHLDAIASRGISFKNAFATGSVTRGGQEAVLCGLPSQRNFSLMRGGILFKYPSCLFSYIKDSAETFWYHGGDGRFDNQLKFWKSQGVHDTLVSANFPTSIPKTSWGIGDITFLETVAQRLRDKKQSTSKPYLFGSALTISNHIPWDIPTDLPADLLKTSPFNKGWHPSHISTSYTDFAIGQFEARLRENALWEDSIIVLISDHGTSLPPYNNIYNQSKSPSLMLLSHIAYIVSGGIPEKILKRMRANQMEFTNVLSQASVATFFLDLIQYSESKSEHQPKVLPMMADHPFALKNYLPILSVVEDRVFSPLSQRSWPLADIVSKSNTDDIEILYFRATIQLFNTPHLN